MSRLRQGLAQLRARGGLSSVLGQALFPVPQEVAAETNPETLNLLRKQALMQMGLGMMAAQNRGAGLGAGLQYGIAQGQGAVEGGLGQIMGVRRMKREEKRLDLAEQRWMSADEREARRDTQHALERSQDVAFRTEQAREAAAARGVDDRRMAAALGLQQMNERDRQERQLSIEKLGNALAKLRRLGKPDEDPDVAALLTHLDALGVNAYRPTGGAMSPLNQMLQQGLGGLSYPPLDNLNQE